MSVRRIPCCVPTCGDKTSKRFSIVREARCRDIWLRRINSKKLFDKSEHQLRQYSVCQNHFVTDCIAENGKLRRFSLPTLNLPDYKSTGGDNFLTQEQQKKIPHSFKKIKESWEALQSKSSLLSTDDCSDMSVIVPKYVYSRKKVFETPTSGTDQESKYIIYPDYHKTMETKKEHTHFEEVYLKSEENMNRSMFNIDSDSDQLVCRACLNTIRNPYPLQGFIGNCNVEVHVMLRFCLGEEVDLGEDLPQNICFACFRTIRIAYNFLNKYKENQEILLNKINISIKSEICDEEKDQPEFITFEKHPHELTSENSLKKRKSVANEEQIQFVKTVFGNDNNEPHNIQPEDFNIDLTSNIIQQSKMEIKTEVDRHEFGILKKRDFPLPTPEITDYYCTPLTKESTLTNMANLESHVQDDKETRIRGGMSKRFKIVGKRKLLEQVV